MFGYFTVVFETTVHKCFPECRSLILLYASTLVEGDAELKRLSVCVFYLSFVLLGNVTLTLRYVDHLNTQPCGTCLSVLI